MRFSGIVLVYLMVSAIFATSVAEFNSINKLKLMSLEFKKKTNAQYFISESFRKTCRGEGFESLNEWQCVCRDMWQLEYIGWGNAEDFMDVSYLLSDKDLMYGKWRGRMSEGEVFCRGE